MSQIVEKSEIHLVITVDGFNRVEVLAHTDSDQAVKAEIMEVLDQISFPLHKFKISVDQTLNPDRVDQPLKVYQ